MTSPVAIYDYEVILEGSSLPRPVMLLGGDLGADEDRQVPGGWVQAVEDGLLMLADLIHHTT